MVEAKIKTKNLFWGIINYYRYKSIQKSSQSIYYQKIFINSNIEAVISELGYQRSEILFFNSNYGIVYYNILRLDNYLLAIKGTNSKCSKYEHKITQLVIQRFNSPENIFYRFDWFNLFVYISWKSVH